MQWAIKPMAIYPGAAARNEVYATVPTASRFCWKQGPRVHTDFSSAGCATVICESRLQQI